MGMEEAVNINRKNNLLVMRLPIIFFVLISLNLLLAGSFVVAEEINSRTVSEADVIIRKSGTINLKKQQDNAFSSNIRLYLSAPQSNGMHDKKIFEINGPDQYEEQKDKYGNDILMLMWDEPAVGEDLEYEILYEVKSEIRQLTGSREDVPYTTYTLPDQEIMDIAYALKKEDDIDTIFSVSRWVYENVEYDLAFSKTAEKAVTVCENRKGTCDEFSNLAISLLKSLGYNAWYSAGWAYTGNKWESHAWIKVYLDDRVIAVDPTWLEYPVDATHIEFSTLPDSNNTEFVESEGAGYKIIWTKSDIELNMTGVVKNNITKVIVDEYTDDISGESHGIIRTNIKSLYGCFLGTLRATSCTRDDGKSLLEIYENEKNIGFCDEKNYNFFYDSPKLSSILMKYSCPVVISTSEGTKEILSVNIEGVTSDKDISVNVNDAVLSGQKMNVDISSVTDGLRIFADFAGMSKDTISESGKASFEFIAPGLPGEYELFVYSSYGAFRKKMINVIKKRNLEIRDIDAPKEVDPGENFTINITVYGLSNSEGVLEVGFIHEKIKEDFSILKNTRREFSIDLVAPGSNKYSELKVALFSEDSFQDGRTIPIKVIVPEEIIKDGANDILNQIMDILLNIAKTIQELIGW